MTEKMTELDHLAILEMLSLIYEELDKDAVEERFVDLCHQVFGFDRCALFYLKHKKEVLKGKLAVGFGEKQISAIEIPVREEHVLTRPLVTGFSLVNDVTTVDPYIQSLGLTNYAVIPLVNKKRIPCWKVNNCTENDCIAYGRKWLRCWLVAGTKCASRLQTPWRDEAITCEECPVFINQQFESFEGVFLVDNSPSGKPISDNVVTILSILGHCVGIAIDNAKIFSRTLRDSIKDDLTALHNRRYFNERLLDEIERIRRYKGPTLSLLMIDADHFKRINDSYGHQEGDAVLVRIAQLLQSKLRKSDVVARLGGEEFGIILLNTSKETAVRLAEELRNMIAQNRFNGTSEDYTVTVSMGVATYGIDAVSPDGLIAKADRFLYQAKAKGRNRVCTA